MELRQLSYFVAVAESLHFGQAAERLQITQPALSKQISGLERELGIQLFKRTKRTVELTYAGTLFLDQARQILRQVTTAIQLARRTACGDVGLLTIGFTETATHTVLPQLVRQFRQVYPDVQIVMKDMSTEAQVVALNDGKIDLAFLHPPIDDRGLQTSPLFEETFVAVIPVGHPLLNYNRIPVKYLANEAFVIHPRHEGPALYDAFIRVCQEAGFQPTIVNESLSLQTRICLVAAGIGITFVSDSLQSLVGKDVVCKPLADCPITLKFAATWRLMNSNPSLHAFLQVAGLSRERYE